MKKELEAGITKDKEKIKKYLIENELKELNIENYTAKIYQIDKSEVNDYKLIKMLESKGLTDAITIKKEKTYREELVCKYVLENILNEDEFLSCVDKNIIDSFKITKHKY